MSKSLVSGIILTIIGMCIVFLFLIFIYLLVTLMCSVIKEKRMLVNIQPVKDNSITDLETAAVICAAIKFLKPKFKTLANKNFDIQRYYNWINFNRNR